jgi:glycerophosphoryl diester phosphodiesterase
MDTPPAIAYISVHRADNRVLKMLLAMKAFSWHPLFKSLTRDQVDMLHSAGLKVFPWTINTRAEAEKVLALGVDGIICNELRVMQAV